MSEGYIKLHRSLLEWEWYHDANTRVLFIHCLLKANWKKTRWHGYDLEPGQFITSLATLAKETGLSVHQVRVALEHMNLTGEVTSKWQGNFRVITVNNWNCYQVNDRQNDKKMATDKESKEVKNKKIHCFPEREIDYETLETEANDG